MTTETDISHLRSRREFVLAAAALWQAALLTAQEHHHVSPPAQSSDPYKFSFFTGEQRTTLRVLISRIIPADERSTGAIGARVDEYIDFVLSHADEKIQKTWQRGLRDYGMAISGKNNTGVDGFLEKQAAYEFAPRTDNDAFFVILKSAVVEGFYTSEVGIDQELGYKGMAFLLDFPGCTHASHQPPADWHPILREAKDA